MGGREFENDTNVVNRVRLFRAGDGCFGERNKGDTFVPVGSVTTVSRILGQERNGERVEIPGYDSLEVKKVES